MNLSFFNQIANEKNGILGLMLALALAGLIILFKLYQKKSDDLDREKDKEIEEAKSIEAKVTLVLEEVNETIKTILIFLEHDGKKEETKDRN